MSESLDSPLVRTPHSEVTATLEVLGRNGVTSEHLTKMGSDNGVASRVALAFVDDLSSSPMSQELAHLVPPPAHMIADLRERFVGSHGFKAEHFDSLAIPRPPLGNFPLVLPVAYLGSLRATLEFYWAMCRKRFPANWLWENLKLDKNSLRVWSPDGQESKWPAGTVRMVGLDLFAYWDKKDGTCVADNRASENAPMPGVEVLALVALAPALIQAIDYERMPGLDMPGLEATPSGKSAWSYAPIVCWFRDDRGVRLHARRVSIRHTLYASPAFRECLPS